jgi:hypothetical protein
MRYRWPADTAWTRRVRTACASQKEASVLRRSVGTALVLLGWALYGAALAAPALLFQQEAKLLFQQEANDLGPGPIECLPGSRCLGETVSPANWLFGGAPVFWCFLANVLMLGSLLLLLAPSLARRAYGLALLAAFRVALVSPERVEGVHEMLEGCRLWQMSFLVCGAGFLIGTWGMEWPALLGYPSVDQSRAWLRRAGWSLEGAASGPEQAPVWVVCGAKGEDAIQATGRTQAEAWWNACRQARALGPLAPPRKG